MSQYPVITSRAAKKDYSDIQAAHADILMGMAAQQVKADAMNQQRATEMQSQATMKHEMDKEKLTANTATAKMANDLAMHQAEIDVKRASLS